MQTKYKLFKKKLVIFQHFTKVGCQYRSHLKAVKISKESADQLADIPN